MIKKKICMLGSFGVGKTSLVARFVLSQYDEKYHTSLGVKVDRKPVKIGDQDVMLMLWDMAGEEENAPVKLNYVHDAGGYILVVDGLRGSTLDVALSIQDRVVGKIGDLPFVVAVNKADQRESWEVGASQLADLGARGWRLFETSAKTGDHVEEAFLTLAGLMLKGQEESADDTFAELN